MKENLLVEVGDIDLIETVYGNSMKEIEFRWINQSNYCMHSDEEKYAEISRELAIKLIKALTSSFDITSDELK